LADPAQTARTAHPNTATHPTSAHREHSTTSRRACLIGRYYGHDLQSIRETAQPNPQSDGDQAVAIAAGVLVSSKSAGSKRASRRLYSFANAGHIVKFRPSAPTYHE
jgi:hypothetical protein